MSEKRKLIGLTGGVATGKSLISKIFKDLGAHIIDADQIARELVEPGQDLYHKIVATFGKEYLKKDKSLDRKKLGALVFASKSKLEKLNNIMEQEIVKQAINTYDDLFTSDKSKLYVYDAATIFEAHAEKYLHKTIVVHVPEEIQIQRLMKRDEINEEKARNIINIQIPIDEKKKRADFIIDNSRDIPYSEKQTNSLFRELLKECNM